MSHLRTCKIGLKNPNVSLLKMAFNDLANQFNGTIVNRVSGVSSSREVLLGLKARNCRDWLTSAQISACRAR
jgi:hypothetical protein